MKYIKFGYGETYRVVYGNVIFIVTMLFAHLLEAGVFASFYLFTGALKDWETSFYFSLVSYATVGYGDITLPQQWRMIGAVEGMVGALMVGWSVAVLVGVLQKLKFIKEH
ncbi:ion channel [Enterobacter mori]|uniref:ion channel n=1 Tax=Enterobacter mori TaxID=539813 RepID=UPI003B8403BE